MSSFVIFKVKKMKPKQIVYTVAAISIVGSFLLTTQNPALELSFLTGFLLAILTKGIRKRRSVSKDI
ncbi:hypothetical protein NO976_01880 [Planktothrix agardhii]|uniref:Uncharacterized protein n=2 Tax=Planktothrix agardhii TaxID=1160 RepID=A0A1J1JE27_PLAAG|nr:hypothetical protein NO976_01880 [Planktothrix agardhii]BBD55807.1 hypothetical protein NIES204_31240 [Planktothrix agardhii NIES-204]CAD5950614.1 hypothetical protein PANO66_02592 [Planktothrix agardhii]CAD5952979.1 hypothetical protein PCC7805_02690 [Planktothrix agardhii]CAD5958564.1 hypothetical protein NO365_03036 [Planktothrix agardhii]